MNNEPVAWMFKTKQEYGGDVVFPDEVEHTKFYYAEQKWNYELIPLYTHPAKTLTLTDDEVEEFEWVLKKHFDFPTNEIVPNLDEIIRAILRKAQEK